MQDRSQCSRRIRYPKNETFLGRPISGQDKKMVILQILIFL